MFEGCSVCQLDVSTEENKLVYCDGKGCSVAVHQFCYGITTVPEGEWFCKPCKSGQPANKVECCLCPKVGGAMKTTDQGAYAHVVCALYVPELTFGDDETMEPVQTSKIHKVRFMRICQFCKERCNRKCSMRGACVKCKYHMCFVYFHVTCAQTKGLLREDIKDNGEITYVGVCEQHNTKGNSSLMAGYYHDLPAESNSPPPPELSVSPGLNITHEAANKEDCSDELETQESVPTPKTLSRSPGTSNTTTTCKVLSDGSISRVSVAGKSKAKLDSKVSRAKTNKLSKSSKGNPSQAPKLVSTKTSIEARWLSIVEKSKSAKSSTFKPKRGRGRPRKNSNKEPTGEKNTSTDSTKVTFTQASKHGLHDVKEELMEVSEQTTAGSLRPIESALCEEPDVDLYDSIERDVALTRKETHEFISEFMTEEERILFKELIRTEEAKLKQQAFIAQLKRRKVQFQLVQLLLAKFSNL